MGKGPVLIADIYNIQRLLLNIAATVSNIADYISTFCDQLQEAIDCSQSCGNTGTNVM